MAISVVLQDERSNNLSDTIHDSTGTLADALPGSSDASYSCLRFVDPYGDTVFNRLQAAAAIGEWDRLRSSFVGKDPEALWSSVREVLIRCSEEPHTYVRFIGD